MSEIGDEIELPTDPKQLQRLVRELSQKQAKDLKFTSSPEYLDLLRKRYQSLLEPSQFNPGDLVRWKPGLNNKALPDVDSVAIVMEQISEPIVAFDRDPGSGYFREPLDLALAVVSGDDRSFIIYWYDSRRFEKA